MKGHTKMTDDAAHAAASVLLPWYAAGELAPAEQAQVREHLSVCGRCRNELAFERRLRGALQAGDGDGQPLTPSDGAPWAAAGNDAAATPPTPAAAPPLPDMERAWAKLQPRLDVSLPASLSVLPWWRRRAANAPSWTRWALAAQFAVIACLGVLLARPAADNGAYRVLGASAGGGNLVVVFKPETSERELRRILQANHARMVDGPTVTDAYLLSVPDPQRARARLRAEPAVALAEALDGGGAP